MRRKRTIASQHTPRWCWVVGISITSSIHLRIIPIRGSCLVGLRIVFVRMILKSIGHALVTIRRRQISYCTHKITLTLSDRSAYAEIVICSTSRYDRLLRPWDRRLNQIRLFFCILPCWTQNSSNDWENTNRCFWSKAFNTFRLRGGTWTCSRWAVKAM